MFGRLYKITQIYSFVNKKEIKEILKHDQIGNVIIDESKILKTIAYEIDNQLCIRLNDLIYLIVNIALNKECNFVRIHLGQLLILILKLINRVINLEQNNLKHDYLDFNRIWLKVKQGQPPFSTIYVQTDYEIHFTGYQCPLYENTGFCKNMKKSIQQIIIQIIERCEQYIKLKSDSSALKEQVLKEIYIPLTESCNNQSLFQTQALLVEKLSHYNSNNQTLPSFDETDTGFLRKQRFQNVQNEMHTIMDKQFNKDPLNLEWTYYFAVKFLANKIKGNFLYSNTAFEYNQVQKKYFQMKDILKNTLEKDNFIKDMIQKFILDKFKSIEEQFKFNVYPEEQQKMANEIFEILLTHKILDYFFNSIWIYLNHTQNYPQYIKALVTKLIVPIIEDRIQEFVKSKVLELLSELI